MITNQCRFIDCDKLAILVGDITSGGGCVCLGQGVCGKPGTALENVS